MDTTIYKKGSQDIWIKGQDRTNADAVRGGMQTAPPSPGGCSLSVLKGGTRQNRTFAIKSSIIRMDGDNGKVLCLSKETLL